MEGLEGLFTEPNGPAYHKREERFGPPLGYVQEKMASSLHDLIQSVDEYVPDDLPQLNKEAGNPFPLKASYLQAPARQAFHYELVAFLALANMLALARESGLVERLLEYEPEEFHHWIRRLELGDSVEG